MRKIFFALFLGIIFSCNQSKISSDMRQGLTFNYKTIPGLTAYKVDGKWEKVDYEYDTIYKKQQESNTVFTYYRSEVYGCPIYLGGYFQKHDTLYLAYQNMNSQSNNLKCVSGIKYTYKIENAKLNYKNVKMIQFKSLK